MAIRTPPTLPPTQPAATSSPSRVPGLDGLRAIAVSAVILFHLTPGFLPGGYIGVDIFFVISGFLITGLLVRERATTGGIRLGHFWRRRARRLLPALGILLLACCTAAWLIGGDVLVHLGRQVLGAVTFSSNWLSIAVGQSYFDEASPELFRNLWSLAVEEQFYLVWPLLVLVLVVIRLRWLRLAIVSLIAVASAVSMAVIQAPGGDATRVYYGTDTHSFGLAIGAVLALAIHPWSTSAIAKAVRVRWLWPLLGGLSVLGLATIAALLPADDALVYEGGLVLVAILTAIAILGSIGPRSWLGRVLDLAPLRWIGERSYGLYLWHWPVFILILAALPGWQRTSLSGWALGGAALVITVLAAALSYRFVEQPIRHAGVRATLRSWFGSGVRIAVSTVAVLLVFTSGTATWAAISDDPGETAAQLSIEQGQHVISSPAPTLTPSPDADGGPLTPGARPQSALPGGDQITAIGDSVMLASAPGLQAGFPGIQIDAVVSRQLSSAPELLQQLDDAGTLRSTLIIGLGTNGPIQRAALDHIRSIIGSQHQIVVVNVQAPRGWTDGVNVTLAQFAQRYRNVELANWKDAIAGHLNLLSRDQIHPGTPGGLIYVGAVRDALQRLAELPPVLGPNDYGLAPTPL
ncbi:acyltransferase family protein [Glaciihabitans sp. UYNi722]|uniref:acyltransferase family protein n=1 Tax=Glaciihabitans sp. UYNi722 TaxID=3156344 RepID=UPI0033949C07